MDALRLVVGADGPLAVVVDVDAVVPAGTAEVAGVAVLLPASVAVEVVGFGAKRLGADVADVVAAEADGAEVVVCCPSPPNSPPEGAGVEEDGAALDLFKPPNRPPEGGALVLAALEVGADDVGPKPEKAGFGASAGFCSAGFAAGLLKLKDGAAAGVLEGLALNNVDGG